MNAEALIASLSLARWHVAVRTYGSDHSTLIGILVDWWISRSPETNRALEGGPGNGLSGAGKRGQCDALLCRGDVPVGVLEVEGTRKKDTARKIGTFFAAKNNHFKTLEFGILALYSYEPRGRGNAREFDIACPPEATEEIQRVSTVFSSKPIFVISIEKAFTRITEGIRSINDYYQGTPTRIEASCYLGGKVISNKIFYPSK